MTTRVLPLVGLICGLFTAAVLIASAAVGGGAYLWTVGWTAYPVVGGLLLWQRPHNRIGWLMVATGTCWALAQLGTYAVTSRPRGTWPAVELAVEALSVGWLFMVATVVCFPTGRPVTRWDRWVLRALGAAAAAVLVAYLVSSDPMLVTAQANPWDVPALSGYARFMLGPGFMIVVGLLVAAVVGVARRWRRASQVERLQYRWLVLGAVFTAAALLVLSLSTGEHISPVAVVPVVALTMSPIPVAIGIAVTRYHLYDVDRVISRTASYAVVTGVLLATYTVVVTSVTRLLPGASKLAVAAATLAAAALARPLYRRVQHTVDRRFNRARYDAEQTVESFGQRLRHEVDTDLVCGDLLGVVHRTLEPQGASLWLKAQP